MTINPHKTNTTHQNDFTSTNLTKDMVLNSDVPLIRFSTRLHQKCFSLIKIFKRNIHIILNMLNYKC